MVKLSRGSEVVFPAHRYGIWLVSLGWNVFCQALFTFFFFFFCAFVFRKLKHQSVTLGLSTPGTTSFSFSHLFAYSPVGFRNACLGNMHNVRFPMGRLSRSLSIWSLLNCEREIRFTIPLREDRVIPESSCILAPKYYSLCSFIFELSGSCVDEIDRIYGFMCFSFTLT